MGGGGGGNDNYEQQQQQIETKKQSARDAVNALFGNGPTSAPVKPTLNPSLGYQLNGGLQKDAAAMADYPSAVEDYNREKQQAGDSAKAREELYQTVRDNAYTAGKRKLDDQRDQASRKLRFEMFARGLNGGSTDIDQNALLGRTYDQGVLDLGARADGAKADLRNSDEQTRLGLLQSIDAGMDQGSALSSALNQMQTNADRATAGAQGMALGDLFSGAGLIYDQGQAAQGRQAGQQSAWAMFPRAQRQALAAPSSPAVTNTY